MKHFAKFLRIDARGMSAKCAKRIAKIHGKHFAKTSKNLNTSQKNSPPLRRKKLDPLIANKIEYVDYKDVALLRKFVSEAGKILPARITGCSRTNQRMIAKAIKRARAIGLLPFAESSN